MQNSYQITDISPAHRDLTPSPGFPGFNCAIKLFYENIGKVETETWLEQIVEGPGASFPPYI